MSRRNPGGRSALAVVTALLFAAPFALPSTSDAQAVRAGVSVTPDTVSVGQPFTVAIRVRAPRGSQLEFPPPPDTTQSRFVEALDPRVIREAEDTSALEQTALFRLVAWDTGTVAIPMANAAVVANGERTPVPVGPLAVYVRSVLPADTALHQPRPAIGILAAAAAWWPWLLGALIGALLLLLLWWLWRRRRRRGFTGRPDPYAEAERAFAHIERLRLLEAGERGRYVALTVDVVRAYLSSRLAGASRSQTSTELLHALEGARSVPLDRLAPVLAEADLIKFARRNVTEERARELTSDARQIVERVEHQEREREVREAEERRAAEAEARRAAKRAAGRSSKKARRGRKVA